MSLPANVTAAPDRHGRMRYRFRKTGLPSRYLPSPQDPGFEEAYQQCFDPDAPRIQRIKRCPSRIKKRKMDIGQYKGGSWVYFICSRRRLVKIGTTVNLPARLKKLQTGSPFKLQIVACVEGGATLEAEYHERFCEHRVNGEWFRNQGPVSAEIERLRRAGCCPTVPPRKMANLQTTGKICETSTA